MARVLAYKSGLEIAFLETSFITSIQVIDTTGEVNLVNNETFRFSLINPESKDQFKKICRIWFNNAIPKEFNL